MADTAEQRPTDPAAAGYSALRSGAILVDRSDRARWRFTGPKSAETVTGLVTNDVLALAPGEGLYAGALTPKGKIVADLRVLREEDGLLVDTGAAAADGWRSMVRKFVNPRVAPFTEVTDATRDIGVFGPESHAIVARALEENGSALDQLRPYAHVRARVRTTHEVVVVRAVDLGSIPGLDLIVPAEAAEEMRARLLELGAVAAPAETFEIARIEAGVPLWGVDMSEDTLPQEANFDELGAISYSKGCYVGQEVVARIHFRGHVNKTLRRVSFEAGAVPASRAELVDETGRVVGDVRSVALSPRLGGVGIAMVRREIESGARLTARWSEGQVGVSLS